MLRNRNFLRDGMDGDLCYAAAMKKLRALWSGDLPLGEAFWTWAVVIGLPLNLATSLAFLTLMTADQPWAALFAGYVLSVPYNLVAVVGVWRSAGRHSGEPAHATLARLAVAALMLVLTLT